MLSLCSQITHLHPSRLGGGMVDTRDLKSLGPQGLYGFESRPRHEKSSEIRCSFCARYLMNEGAFPLKLPWVASLRKSAFHQIWLHLVAFSVHYLNTPLDYINHLIDKSFNSHQEYMIATDSYTTVRGTKNSLNCSVLPNSSFAFSTRPITVNVITCFDIGIKFFPCRIIKVLGTGRYR